LERGRFSIRKVLEISARRVLAAEEERKAKSKRQRLRADEQRQQKEEEQRSTSKGLGSDLAANVNVSRIHRCMGQRVEADGSRIAPGSLLMLGGVGLFWR